MTEDEQRIAWYEAGMDGTPRGDARPTPGQLWYRLLSLSRAERIDLLERFMQDADTAFACNSHNHTGAIAERDERVMTLEIRLRLALGQIDEMRAARQH